MIDKAQIWKINNTQNLKSLDSIIEPMSTERNPFFIIREQTPYKNTIWIQIQPLYKFSYLPRTLAHPMYKVTYRLFVCHFVVCQFSHIYKPLLG